MCRWTHRPRADRGQRRRVVSLPAGDADIEYRAHNNGGANWRNWLALPLPGALLWQPVVHALRRANASTRVPQD